MHLFYTPDIAETLTLPEVESGHCVRVLRLVEGDEIGLIDGRGTFYRASIDLAHNKRCKVRILEERSQPLIGQGLLRWLLHLPRTSTVWSGLPRKRPRWVLMLSCRCYVVSRSARS